MFIQVLKEHCSKMTIDCKSKEKICPLYDPNYKKCLLSISPQQWDIEKIKQAFEQIATFKY